ncbi:MAG: hypothetical protein PQJ58_11770 [Spirochaetales bacterium]|nr:hypothetical protein [Spirochaetales bacterium]
MEIISAKDMDLLIKASEAKTNAGFLFYKTKSKIRRYMTIVFCRITGKTPKVPSKAFQELFWNEKEPVIPDNKIYPCIVEDTKTY